MSALTLRLDLTVDLDAEAAFDLLTAELVTALHDRGLRLEVGPDGGLLAGEVAVAAVEGWAAGRGFRLRWLPMPWMDAPATEVELRCEPAEAGLTRVTVTHTGWPSALGGHEPALGWFATQVVAPVLAATAPEAVGDWLTDRIARRPAGAAAKATYRDPLYHYPNFRVILLELALSADDRLLEVGCGGGAFLREALRSGCRAAAIDHSPDMLAVAREQNAAAIAEGRLVLHEGDAHRLPFPDEAFTCAAMTGVLGFLRDPARAFAEIHRTLRPGGRLVALGSDPELRGTPAAPEPVASRLRFYDDDGLAALARAGGFRDVRVERRPLGAHAKAAGVPAEHLDLFAGSGARFLMAVKG